MTRTVTKGTSGAAVVAALLAALALACGACSSPVPRDAQAPPPSAPEQWFEAYHDAVRQGVFNLGAFYSQTAHLDADVLGLGPATDRATTIQTLATAFPSTAPPQSRGAVYVSATAAVVPQRITRTAWPQPHDAALLTAMSDAGIEDATYASSELAWRADRPEDPRILPMHVLAQDYTRAWSTGSPDQVASLYANAADLSDDLLGISATGARDIAALAQAPTGSGGLLGATLDALPDLGGPAAYVVGSTGVDDERPLRAVVLLVTVDGANGCPGALAIALTVNDQGRITREARHHRIDDLLRCAGRLPPGWWDTAPLPAAVATTQTATLLLGGSDVPVFNGTPELNQMLTWAFDRYLKAGLTPPTIARVTFYNPQIDLCRGILGLTLRDTVSLCFDAPTACDNADCARWRPWTKDTLLHELAHAWIQSNLDPDTQQAFTQQAGLPTWASATHPWAQRGVELAASTIAWALMDEPISVHHDFPIASCDQLAPLYQTLVGSPPAAPPPCRGIDLAEATS